MRRNTAADTAGLPSARSATTELLKDLKGVSRYKKPPVPTNPFSPVEAKEASKKAMAVRRGSPVTDYVRSLPGGPYLTTLEVAKELKVSPQLIRKYVKDPEIPGPSYAAPFGRIRIYLYTEEDVQRLKDHLAARKIVIPIDKSTPMSEPEVLKRARENKK